MDTKKEDQLKKISSIMDKTQSLYTKWAKNNNISYPMLVVIYTLYLEENIKQRDLVEDHGIPKQTIGTIISELETKKYVTISIDENNKRSKNVKLTKRGKQYAETIINPLLNCEKKVFDKMGNRNFEMLIEINQQYALFLEEEMSKYDN